MTPTHELIIEILFFVAAFGLIIVIPPTAILIALGLSGCIKDHIKKLKK